MPMCRVISCVVRKERLLSLGKTLLAFALLHFVFQDQTCLLLPVSLDFLLLHSSPLWWKGHFFGVLVLEGLLGLHWDGQLLLLQHQWLRNRLRLPWCLWFALEMNQNHSVPFKIALKNCISDSLVDYEGYSISSMGFLPTVIDIMDIWIKFAHFCLF